MYEGRYMDVFEIEMRVSGKIELAARDLDGSVLAIQLNDNIGNVYLIDDNAEGDKLLSYIGSVVEITGQVRKEDSIKIIRVSSYVVGG